jgi:hypothetical protein
MTGKVVIEQDAKELKRLLLEECWYSATNAAM